MVRFTGVEQATWIVENLNGNIPEGLDNPIKARFANAPGGKSGGKGDDGKGKGKARPEPYGAAPATGGGPPVSDNVWVGDLPHGTEQDHLHEIFEPYGQIVRCRVLPGRDDGAKPAAMVQFASVDLAVWVVENLNGNIPEGLDEPIAVRFANVKSDKGGHAAPAGGKGHDSWGGGKAAAPPRAPVGASRPAAPVKGKAAGSGKSSGKGKAGGAPATFESLWQSVKGAGILTPQKVPDECQIYVKSLPADTTDADLYRLFSAFGAISPNGVKAMLNGDGSCKGIGFVDYFDPEAAAAAVESLDGHTLPDGSCIGVSTKMPSAGPKPAKGKGKKK
jgi:polyadenylate-binding protein